MKKDKENTKDNFVETIEKNATDILINKYGLPSNIRVRYYNPLSNSLIKREETKEENPVHKKDSNDPS